MSSRPVRQQQAAHVSPHVIHHVYAVINNLSNLSEVPDLVSGCRPLASGYDKIKP